MEYLNVCHAKKIEEKREESANATKQGRSLNLFFCSEWDLTVDVACDFFLLPIDTKHTVNWPWLTKFISSHIILSSDATPTDLDSSSQPVKMSKDAPLIPGCPLCDSSVFSYCDVKIYHDACWWVVAITCWWTWNNLQLVTFHFSFLMSRCSCGLSLPQCAYQQQSQGCQMLYANSCEEHQLIMQCCCYNPQYRKIE